MTRTATTFGLFAALALGSLSGCNKSPADKLDAVADKLCACEDADCARGVREELGTVLESFTEEDAKKDEAAVKKALAHLEECDKKVSAKSK